MYAVNRGISADLFGYLYLTLRYMPLREKKILNVINVLRLNLNGNGEVNI